MLKTDYKYGEVFNLAGQIESGADRVHFKGIMENENGSIALVAFKAGQKLDTHTAPFEVMVTVLEGDIEFTMNGIPRNIKSGEFLLMGADVPHSLRANSDAKFMLTKIKP